MGKPKMEAKVRNPLGLQESSGVPKIRLQDITPVVYDEILESFPSFQVFPVPMGTPPHVKEQEHSWEGRGAIAMTPGTLTKQETFFHNLSLPISTAIIGCDSVEQVEECAELARSFTPLSLAQMATLEARVEPIAKPALLSGSCHANDG
jgi:hypothetical protein